MSDYSLFIFCSVILRYLTYVWLCFTVVFWAILFSFFILPRKLLNFFMFVTYCKSSI